MKKWLSLCLCVLLLLSLTACHKTPPAKTDDPPAPVDEKYEEGMEKLAAGDLTEAYTLLKAATDPRAEEELEKFVFVPTKMTTKFSDSGQDAVTTYTYDGKGNLLEEKKTGKSGWTTKVDMCETYTYDEGNRVLTRAYRHNDYSFTEIYTYDKDGNELSYGYFLDEDKTAYSGHTCTYDARGNLVKKECFDGLDAAYNYTITYTYDEQDRILTRTHNNYHGDTDVTTYVATYVYAEDGSYHSVYVGEDYTQTIYYDKEDRLIKSENIDHTGELLELNEYRYDEQGNEVYRRSYYWGEETIHTSTYNEQGLLLKAEATRDGEIYSVTTYTYDKDGNRLTYEYFSGQTSWGRETRTYDPQGHLLTWQRMGNYGWDNYTYTYDETGNRTKEECRSNTGHTTEEYTRDQWGNVILFNSYTVSDGEEVARQASMEWQLQYYPDHIPDAVSFVIDNATWD